MKTAIFVRSLDWTGDARLYRLGDPIGCGWDGEAGTTDHVVVSAVVVLFSGPETYIFPATSEGKVISWGELEGSFRGGLDHAVALMGAGYSIAPEPTP
jgi:hypothetical protein